MARKDFHYISGSGDIEIGVEDGVLVQYVAGVKTSLGGGGGATSLATLLAASTDAGANKITNLADPASPQDAATKNYIDTNLRSINGLLVAANDAPAWVKAHADYVCDGVDDDVQIQAAIDAAAGGGKVFLSPGNFLGGQIVVKDRVHVDGCGEWATNYKLKNSANVDVFINFVSPDGVVANAEFIKITNLRIDGNAANQTTAGRGIYLNINPSATKATNDKDFDPHNRVENVLIENTFGNGFESASRSETRLKNVYVNNANGSSFVPSYDMFIEGCTSSGAGLMGFDIQHSSVRLTDCKAFYSGRLTATSGHGFHVGATFGVVIAGCEAQDNKACGILLDGASGCDVQLSCDSNSTRGVGFSPAIDVWGGGYHRIVAVCTERKADGTNSFQQHALRIRNASVGSNINISHYAQSGATVGTVIDTIDSTSFANELTFNGMGSTVLPAYAATYTPDPFQATYHRVGALTAAITIAAPSNSFVGCLLTVILQQDATGSRTITWNAVFKNTPTTSTAANSFTVGRFVYDGTNWVGI